MNAGEVLDTAGLLDAALYVEIHPIDPFQVRLRPAPRLVRSLWGVGMAAMTLGNIVLVEPDLLAHGGDRLSWVVVHELVHVRQWRELGPLRFLVEYLGAYLGGRRRGLGHRGAYQVIWAEVEARETVTRLRG